LIWGEDQNIGHRPDVDNDIPMWLFDIEFIGLNCKDGFNFDSKWTTPKKELAFLAELFHVDIEVDFEELSMNIYGRALYSHVPGRSFSIELEDSDFNYDGDVYRMENETEHYENKLDNLIWEYKNNN